MASGGPALSGGSAREKEANRLRSANMGLCQAEKAIEPQVRPKPNFKRTKRAETGGVRKAIVHRKNARTRVLDCGISIAAFSTGPRSIYGVSADRRAAGDFRES